MPLSSNYALTSASTTKHSPSLHCQVINGGSRSLLVMDQSARKCSTLCSFARATTRIPIPQNGRASRNLRIVEADWYIATITEIRRNLSERKLLLLASGIPVCQARIPSFSSAPNADRVLGIYIGVDISSELSTIVDEMHLITRSGAWVWPRFLFGHPYESYLGNHHPSIVKQYIMHKKAYSHNLGRFCMTVMPAFISLFLVQMMLVIANGAIPPALKPKHNIMGAHPTSLAPSYSVFLPTWLDS